MQKKTMSELDRKSIEEFKDSKKNKIVLVLDDVRSMHNVGACFRTADAFLLEKIFLCERTPKPPHRDIHKTALGATETVSWHHFETTVEALQVLKNDDYELIAIEQTHNSIFLNDFKIDENKKYALVFGHEVNGVQQEIISMCDKVIEVPQQGSKHSLNISVCVGVVCWEFVR